MKMMTTAIAGALLSMLAAATAVFGNEPEDYEVVDPMPGDDEIRFGFDTPNHCESCSGEIIDDGTVPVDDNTVVEQGEAFTTAIDRTNTPTVSRAVETTAGSRDDDVVRRDRLGEALDKILRSAAGATR